MNWDDLDLNKPKASKAKKESEAKFAELTKAYSRCFGTEEGQKVLQDISSRFIYNNDVSFDAKNINYEAAYRNGEGAVAKFIIHMITRAKG